VVAAPCRGTAWTLDKGTGQHHVHNFLLEQAVLKWSDAVDV